MLPTQIGNYQIVTQLGHGGMARALLAIRLGRGGFQKLFVIKQLSAHLSTNDEYIKMFLDEARLAALLNHPNVVQTHEIGEDGDAPYISMEYLEGQSLGRVKQKVDSTQGVVLSLGFYVRVIMEVLLGLHYAHELTDLHGNSLSLVHRDISPENIFITYDGQVKLLDFGIAKVSGTGDTDAGVPKGKIAYMAPEQVMSKTLDRRTDLFSMGVLLWEAVTGQPFLSCNEPGSVTFFNRVEGNWVSARGIKPDAPSALLEICDKAMALDPEERYGNAMEMRAALSDFVEQCEVPPAARSLGQLVTSLFNVERAKVREMVANTIGNYEQREIDYVVNRPEAHTDNSAMQLTTLDGVGNADIHHLESEFLPPDIEQDEIVLEMELPSKPPISVQKLPEIPSEGAPTWDVGVNAGSDVGVSTVALLVSEGTGAKKTGVLEFLANNIRHRFALAIAFSLVVGFMIMSPIASSREAGMYDQSIAELSDAYTTANTAIAWDNLQHKVKETEERLRTLRFSLVVTSLLIWLVISASLAFLLLRVVDWQRWETAG